GQVLNGLLDELTIYNRALSPEEIRCIAQAGAAGKCKIPPSISIQPAHQAVLVGGAASFSVTADGTPNLRYQWRFNSTNIPDATRSLLIVTNVQLADAGAYSVQVTNGFGSTASSDATLSIDHPPVVSCANVTVAAGPNCFAVYSG